MKNAKPVNNVNTVNKVLFLPLTKKNQTPLESARNEPILV